MVELPAKETAVQILCENIRSNRYQPRKHFDPIKLQELAESIRESGLQQPVVVRPLDGNGTYELVLGERRLRAVEKNLSRESISAFVRELTDERALEIVLIENIQREDLTLIEEARSLQSLVEHYGGNVSHAAQRIGKNAPYVSKRITLLTLPEEVQNFLDEGKLTLAHGEAILEIVPDQQVRWARESVQRGLTVNQLKGASQRHVKKNSNGGTHTDSIKFQDVSGGLVRLYEAVNKFEFEKLNDESKRATLRRQIDLVQRSLTTAAEKLVLPTTMTDECET